MKKNTPNFYKINDPETPVYSEEEFNMMSPEQEPLLPGATKKYKYNFLLRLGLLIGGAGGGSNGMCTRS